MASLEQRAESFRTEQVKGNPKSISFVQASEIELKPIKWLVKDYFESHAITFLYGDTEAFKTFICLDIACAIATGEDWIPDCPTKQGLVLYICGEGRNGIRRRLEAWSKHNKQPIPENLLISDMSTDLSDTDAISDLVGAIESLGTKPAVVIVDTFARNYTDGGENANDDIGKFYSVVEATLVKTYDCSVIVTHHPGKDTSKGMRGGASLKQNADAVYKVKREDSGEQMFTVMKPEKMKDAERPKDVMFEAIKYPIGISDSFGGESSSLAMDFVNDAERQMITEEDEKDSAAIAANSRKRLLREILDDGSLNQVDYAARAKVTQTSVSRHQNWLRKKHYLKGSSRRLEVTPSGQKWCNPSGRF